MDGMAWHGIVWIRIIEARAGQDYSLALVPTVRAICSRMTLICDLQTLRLSTDIFSLALQPTHTSGIK